MFFVFVAFEPSCLSATLNSSQETTPVAIELSMIELMTSETPRVTLSTAMMPAQAAPTSIASTRAPMTLRKPGSQPWPAKSAAAKAATRYWPSTPMLNRFIRKPMATAIPER